MISQRLKKLKPYILAQLKKEKLSLEKETDKKVFYFSTGIPKYPPAKAYAKRLQETVKEKKSIFTPPTSQKKSLKRLS